MIHVNLTAGVVALKQVNTRRKDTESEKFRSLLGKSFKYENFFSVLIFTALVLL